MIEELNSFTIGRVTYFRYAQCKGPLGKLESWIRRKLRCVRLKQCKTSLFNHDVLPVSRSPGMAEVVQNAFGERMVAIRRHQEVHCVTITDRDGCFLVGNYFVMGDGDSIQHPGSDFCNALRYRNRFRQGRTAPIYQQHLS